jgi:NADH-quinone oxidoreductase subunit J
MAFVFFAYFAVVSIVAGILTVALKNPVQCGLALLALLLHVSGLFVMLNAEFLWAVQVIVYAGAILVLYLFVLMLLNLKTDDRYFHAKAPYLLAHQRPSAWPTSCSCWCDPRSAAPGAMPPPAAILLNGDAHAIGIKMFSEYLLQFEIIGVFLTGAIVGAIVLAKTPKSIETRRDA